MDGLEKIILKIEEDAESASASVIHDAEKKAEQIIAEAESKSDAEARDMISAAEAERDVMIKKAHSGGEQAKKQTILSRKVDIIENTVSRAVDNFIRDDAPRYFDAMIKLAVKYAFDGKQEMVFSDRDMARLPVDFEKNLADAVGKKADITVRGGGSFEGGFLLISPDMVENCTVSALVGAAETDIKDELCKLLFANQ